MDALTFEKMLKGDMNLAQWERRVMTYAQVTRLESITWGDWYQVGYTAFALSKTKYLLTIALRRIQNWWLG